MIIGSSMLLLIFSIIYIVHSVKLLKRNKFLEEELIRLQVSLEKEIKASWECGKHGTTDPYAG